MISVKAFKQRYDDKRGKEPPWTSSKEASRRAKEELERAKQVQKDKPREQTKTTRNSGQVAWKPEEKRPLRNAVEEETSSSSEESSDDK